MATKRPSQVSPTSRKSARTTGKQVATNRRGYRQGPAQLSRQLATVDFGGGFPKRARMRHKYAETVLLTSTTGAISNYLFRCNGMFDPNFTGTGHQPMYFDQMGNIWNYYIVLSSKISVTFAVADGSAANMSCNLWLNDDGTVVASNVDTIREYPETKFGTVTQDATLTLKSNFNLKSRYGNNNESAAQYSADISNNPLELANYVISVQSTDALVTNEVTAQVVIEYDAVWYEIRDLAQS